jgi:dimethylaniline monooxygenase (N-oxide forming)
MDDVAIVGAGPAGLAAARWLKREGFDPVLFEQGSGLGGQWSAEPGRSGVWPGMRTNTCREMTRFSDLDHAPGTRRYPTHEGMLAYLSRYAQHYDLAARVRTRTRVTVLSQCGDGSWSVRFTGPDGEQAERRFARVVVASGRFQKPHLPAVPGLASFSGRCGVNHTFDYKRPAMYRGARVLVAGCAVSALEIACDLAGLGAARVVTSNRRQRYILPKLVGGVPAEYLLHTRRAALLQERSPSAVAASVKALALATCGDPSACGAPEVDDDLLAAGTTQCQHYLAMVAEGRIATRPWLESVDGATVRFLDGSEEEFDALIFGTGFDLHLPFLDDATKQRVGLARGALDLYGCTFHPDLPGLAFAGQFQVAGPYLPPIELQARWIAYTWSGSRPLPSPQAMRGLMGSGSQVTDKYHMGALTVQFARHAGVEPDLERWPELRDDLLDAPLTPVSLRLQGRDALLCAAREIRDAAMPGTRLRQQLRGCATLFRTEA